MSKIVMYIILTVTMGIGGYVPVLFGADALGGWSILGGLVGGIVGIWAYMFVRNQGYLD